MTGLTLPRAGTRGGAAPQVRVEADQTGGLVADFGAKLKQIGDGLEKERLDHQATRAQIEINRRLGDLRLEFEQMNDPDRIAQEWQPRVDAVRAEILGGTDGGLPGVDPKIADRVGLAFDELAVRHGQAVGRVQLAARQTRQAARWMELSDATVRAGAEADADTQATLLQQAYDHITSDLENGLIDEVEAARRRLELRDRTAEASAILMIDVDPEGYLAKAEAGEFDGLDPVKAARYVARARSNLAQREDAERRAAELAATEREKEIGRQLDTIADIAGDGQISAAEDEFLARPDVRAHPDYGRAAAAVMLRDEYPNFRQMTPAELEAALAAERAKPKTAAYQTERASVLEKALAEAEKGWAQDPMGHAQAVGLGVAELPEFDAADPAAFIEGLAARVADAEALGTLGYASGASPFTKDEAAALRARIGANADPAERAELATAIVAATGGRIGPVANALEADAVFRYGAGLIAGLGAPGRALATEMFQGQKRIEQKTVNLPSEKNLIAFFDERTSQLFEADPDLKRQILSAATALYGDSAAEVDPEDLSSAYFFDGAAAELFERSVQRVLGANWDTDGQQRGGIQDVGGQSVLLPPTMSAQAAELAMERTRVMIRRGDMSALQGALLSQGVPDLGDAPGRTFGNLNLEAIADDAYQLWTERGGVRTYLENEDGSPVVLSLTRLLRGVRQ